MRNSLVKRLRSIAREETVGLPEHVTHKLYKQMKKNLKENRRAEHFNQTKMPPLSKRQERLRANGNLPEYKYRGCVNG